MTIDNLGENDYIQRWLKGQFQAAFAENGANPDPYIMYGRYFGPGANLGVPSGYSSPALASLLTNADQNPSAVRPRQPLRPDQRLPGQQRGVDLAVRQLRLHRPGQ